jgi:hypothetical protein
MVAAAQVASVLSVPLLSAILGGAIALVFLAGYLRRKRADIAHVPPSATAAAPDLPKQLRPANQHRKGSRPHHHAAAADKVHPSHPTSSPSPLARTDPCCLRLLTD